MTLLGRRDSRLHEALLCPLDVLMRP